jgi:hypothetical protein
MWQRRRRFASDIAWRAPEGNRAEPGARRETAPPPAGWGGGGDQGVEGLQVGVAAVGRDPAAARRHAEGGKHPLHGGGGTLVITRVALTGGY